MAQTTTIQGGPQLRVVWASLLASPAMIAAAIYFFASELKGIMRLPADSDIWFLAGGLASTVVTLPFLRRFRSACALPRGQQRTPESWQRIYLAMMVGISIAEIPFFVGLAAYYAGGFTQTAAILLVVTLALQSRFMPPLR